MMTDAQIGETLDRYFERYASPLAIVMLAAFSVATVYRFPAHLPAFVVVTALWLVIFSLIKLVPILLYGKDRVAKNPVAGRENALDSKEFRDPLSEHEVREWEKIASSLRESDGA
jgi:hypothetical protein